MAKKITGYVKLQVPAGAAKPSPPIGPALGQRGINIMEFCKAFNAQTQEMEKDTPIPVVITLPGQVLHLRDEDAAGELLPQEGREPRKRAPRSRATTRSARSPAQGARDRRREDEGSQRQRRSKRPCAWSKAPPARWAWKWWELIMAGKARQQGPRRRRSRQVLSARRGGEARQGTREGEVRRDRSKSR